MGIIIPTDFHIFKMVETTNQDTVFFLSVASKMTKVEGLAIPGTCL